MRGFKNVYKDYPKSRPCRAGFKSRTRMNPNHTVATNMWPPILGPLGFASVALRLGIPPSPCADRESGREPGGAARPVSCRVLVRVCLRLPRSVALLRGPLSGRTNKYRAAARLLCCCPYRQRDPAETGCPSSHRPPGGSEPRVGLPRRAQ